MHHCQRNYVMITASWKSRIATWWRSVFGVDSTAKSPTIIAPMIEPPKIESPNPYKWPNCASPTDFELKHGFYGSLNLNGTQYKKVESEPGCWQWVVDQEIMERNRSYETRRAELWWALYTRVISDEEMDEVLRYGEGISLPYNRPYHPGKKQRELSEAFVAQERLRAARRSRGELGGRP